MSDKKNQQQPQIQLNKPQPTIAPVIVDNKTEAKVQKIKDKKEEDQKLSKLNSKKLGLVLYEIAKQRDSVFTEQQKVPVMLSFGGVFVTLCSATLINLGQAIMKPDQRKKKWFFIFGMGNLLAATFLFGYSVYHISDMYMKVPEQQWIRIEKEKEEYEKLSFTEKRSFLMKQLEEEQKKKKEELLGKQKQSKREKIQIAK